MSMAAICRSNFAVPSTKPPFAQSLEKLRAQRILEQPAIGRETRLL